MLTTEVRRDAAALLLLALLITAAFSDLLFLGQSFVDRDLPVYNIPIKKVVRDLIRSGEFPYWNRLFAGGQPVAANPAYELFYPPQWLVLLPSFLVAIKLQIVFHLYLAAFGMYALVRGVRLRPAAAVFAAIAFSLGGPLVSFIPLMPLLFNVAWMPWVFFFALRRGRGSFAGAAIALAMQVLIGEPFVFASTCGLLVLSGFVGGGRRGVMRSFGIVVVAVLLGAVQMLPAIDHAGDSARSVPLPWGEVKAWSMPLVRPIELFFPRFAGDAGSDAFFGGPALWGKALPFITSIYLGLLTGALVLAGLLARVRYWSAVLLIAVGSYVIAIGEHTPLLRALFDAGVFSSVRFPEKMFIPALVVMVVFAAATLDALLGGDERVRSRVLSVLAVTTVAGALAAIPDIDFLLAGRREWLIAAVRAAVLIAILLLCRGGRFRYAGIALVTFTVFDVVPLSLPLLHRQPDRFYDAPPLVAQLPQRAAMERLYHGVAAERERGAWPAPLPAEVRAWLGRNDMHPFLPAAWQRETAMDYDFDLTTLYPTLLFEGAKTLAAAERHPSWPRQFMAMANAPLRTEAIDLMEQLATAPDIDSLRGVRIVRELEAAPRYYFASSVVACRGIQDCLSRMRERSEERRLALVPGAVFEASEGEVLRASETSNETTIDVAVQSRAFLVMSVTNHKYWRAKIDGRDAPIVPTNLAWQGLDVPPGRHRIHLVYRNPLIAVGAAISVATLLALVGGVAMKRVIPSRHGRLR